VLARVRVRVRNRIADRNTAHPRARNRLDFVICAPRNAFDPQGSIMSLS